MSHETVPMNGRIYLTIAPGVDGRMQLNLSRLPPNTKGALAVLLSRGVLIGGGTNMAVELVSDPSADPDLAGPAGPNGWTPIMAGELDGTRSLLKVVDWVSGKGAKPALGYVGGATATGLVGAKADAFNFNAGKRVDIFAGTTAATGIATITFSPAFTAVPAKALPMAANNLLAGPVTAEIVAGSLTKTGCQVKVTQKALLTGVVSLVAGSGVSVIAIEA